MRTFWEKKIKAIWQSSAATVAAGICSNPPGGHVVLLIYQVSLKIRCAVQKSPETDKLSLSVLYKVHSDFAKHEPGPAL